MGIATLRMTAMPPAPQSQDDNDSEEEMEAIAKVTIDELEMSMHKRVICICIRRLHLRLQDLAPLSSNTDPMRPGRSGAGKPAMAVCPRNTGRTWPCLRVPLG